MVATISPDMVWCLFLKHASMAITCWPGGATLQRKWRHAFPGIFNQKSGCTSHDLFGNYECIYSWHTKRQRGKVYYCRLLSALVWSQFMTWWVQKQAYILSFQKTVQLSLSETRGGRMSFKGPMIVTLVVILYYCTCLVLTANNPLRLRNRIPS